MPILAVFLCLFLIVSAAPLHPRAPENCTFPDITYESQLSNDEECGGHLRPGTESCVIQKHGYCRFLDNGSGNDYFGPARTEAEFRAYKAARP